MDYYFDEFGILSSDVIPGRSTNTAPPNTPLPSGYVWRWEGYSWEMFDPSPPSTVPVEPLPYQSLIDVGPFFDRFGTAKMQVLTSQDIAVQAIIKDVQVRKWIDLSLPEVTQSLDYIRSKVPAVTLDLQEQIIMTPVLEAENLALRKLYF